MEPQIRAQRISEALRTELAEMISFELADPRVDGVLVNEVHVSPDLKKAAFSSPFPPVPTPPPSSAPSTAPAPFCAPRSLNASNSAAPPTSNSSPAPTSTR
jgi:hypothetical protein